MSKQIVVRSGERMPEKDAGPTPVAEPTPVLGPVRAHERIEVLDILRGFALTGVLLVNMMNFGGHWDRWTGSVDMAFHVVEFFFFEERFWHLFSMLFGIGFAMQWLRADAKGVSVVPVYLRRLVILFGFGAFTYILWGVDILTDYAVLGVILLSVRRWSPSAVLVLALLVLLAPTIQWVTQENLHAYRMRDLGYAAELQRVQEREADERRRRDEDEDRVLGHGSFAEVVAMRARGYIERLEQHELRPASESTWGLFAMFLVGMYVGKRKILQEYATHRRFVRTVGWLALLVGVVGMGLLVWKQFYLQPWQAFFLQPNTVQWSLAVRAAFGTTTILGFTGMMFFYAYVLSEWSLSQRWRSLQRGFAAVGRTALSNYLLQNMLMNVIFMGWGLGFYGQLGPAKTMLLSGPVYVTLMLLSVWWLRYFRFGPAEWVWRSLTYGKLQPMRAPVAAPILV